MRAERRLFAALARDQILESIGWCVLRIPAWQCLAEPDRVAT